MTYVADVREASIYGASSSFLRRTRRVDAETFEFGAARRLARAEIDAAIRAEIERRDALGHGREEL